MKIWGEWMTNELRGGVKSDTVLDLLAEHQVWLLSSTMSWSCTISFHPSLCCHFLCITHGILFFFMETISLITGQYWKCPRAYPCSGCSKMNCLYNFINVNYLNCKFRTWSCNNPNIYYIFRPKAAYCVHVCVSTQVYFCLFSNAEVTVGAKRYKVCPEMSSVHKGSSDCKSTFEWSFGIQCCSILLSCFCSIICLGCLACYHLSLRGCRWLDLVGFVFIWSFCNINCPLIVQWASILPACNKFWICPAPAHSLPACFNYKGTIDCVFIVMQSSINHWANFEHIPSTNYPHDQMVATKWLVPILVCFW